MAIIFDHSRLALENILFPNKITRSPTYTTFYFNYNFIFFRLIHTLSNHSVEETVDNRTAPKYNFMQHTIVLGGSQKIYTLHSFV